MKKSCMMFLAMLPACAAAFAGNHTADTGCHLVPVAPAYSATSVNTAVFRANSVTTHGNTQYTCFYDPDGYVTIGAPSTRGTWPTHTM